MKKLFLLLLISPITSAMQYLQLPKPNLHRAVEIALLSPKTLDAYIQKKGGISKLTEDELEGFIKNIGGIERLTNVELMAVVKHKGGITKLNESELQAFVRNKGGYARLTCDELHDVVLTERLLHPEKLKAFLEARDNRLKREIKQKKLNAMKRWTRQQAADYIHEKPLGEKFDCDELNILNDILEPEEEAALSLSQKSNSSLTEQAPLTNSKKKLLQEKFVKFIPGKQRWPNVDFSLWNEEQLDAYTNSFDLTSVETDFISQRHTEITQLKYIDHWDSERAKLFLKDLLNKESVNRDQWRKISCKIGLTVIEIKKMINPMSRADYQELLEQHTKELAEREVRNKIQNEDLALDDNNA